MSFLDFKPCLHDPETWMRLAVKACGAEYYKFVILYTDDALVISENDEKSAS